MKLVVLGSGTSIPHPARSSAAYWLEMDNQTLLLDISADAPHRMAQEQLDWANLDAIWISHLHLDHCAGLAPLLFTTRSAPQTQARRKPLTVFGAAGFKRLLQAIDEANNYDLLRQPFPVHLIEVEPGTEFEILPGVIARTFSTPHTKESQAIRLLDKKGSIIVYTSDTGFSKDLATFANGADLLLIECSFYKDKPVDTHLELREAMQIAETCAPGKIMLGHLYSNWDGIDLAGKAKLLWPGETLEAVDGLRLEI
ncbi:MAG: MBL fold metallo-hydrolase [Pyrinomonadaceae bacterium]